VSDLQLSAECSRVLRVLQVADSAAAYSSKFYPLENPKFQIRNTDYRFKITIFIFIFERSSVTSRLHEAFRLAALRHNFHLLQLCQLKKGTDGGLDFCVE
jgi:hypothetical protein